jgi:hypothetical protein
MVARSLTALVRAVFLGLLLVGASLSAGGQSKTQPAPGGAPNPDDVWKRFRAGYPYPVQGVAIQKINDGEVVLIVSEPPPRVTEADLKAILPGVKFARWRVGADGWVTDAVVRLKVSDPELMVLVADLHRLMYGTAYKAYALDIPANPRPIAPHPSLDLKIAADDVLSWVVTGGETGKAVAFRPLIGGDPVAYAGIKEPDSLVYHSDPEGLVGWWIPKTVSVSDCRVPARQFAVDSDLVLGAVGDDRGVLVVGRRRVVPYEVLPPLRTESILLLAGIGRDELSQTINPQRLSAFINADPSERWELNLLSPELYDTELGTLLTIADVLLKSWTEHGLNQVRGFHDYPRPKTLPFDAPPIAFGADSVVFNYNSTAAGRYLEVADGRTVLSTVRTGVLPISYFPDGAGAKDKRPQKVLQAEQTAYEWFAKQSDPHLVRVVQYTTLFQAFRAFKVKAEPARGWMGKDVVVQEHRAAVREMIEKVQQLDGAGVNALVKRMDECPETASLRKQIGTLQKRGKITEKQAEAFSKQLSPAGFRSVLDEMRGLSADDRDTLAAVLVGAGRLPDEFAPVVRVCRILASAERVDESLAKRLSERSRGWVHSPVLIYDHNEGELALGEGGHNWTTQTPRIRLDPEVPRGQVPAPGPDGVYRVNPADLRNLTVRGRGEAPLLGKDNPAQPMTTTLGGPQKFDQKSQYGWQRSSTPLSNEERAAVTAVRKERGDAVCVFAQPDGSYRVATPRAEFEARTHKELVDVLLDTNTAKMVDTHLFGVNADQAYAVRMTLLARRGGAERTVRTTTTRPKPDAERPTTFDPTQYKADKDAIKSYQIVDGKGHLGLELPPTQAGKPAARVNVVIQASNKVLTFLAKVRDKFLQVINRALRGSKTPEEFHARFREEFRATFKDDLTAAELDEVRIETEYLLRFEDQYLSEGAKDDRGSRAVG